MLSNESKYLRTPEYQFADMFDKHMRNQKNQETNGILTGPFTSRIFSEIILAAIDKSLNKKGYTFKRYIDDYKFYFRSQADAQHAVIEVAKVLAEYNLSINQSKIEITEYPFDIESPMKRVLEDAFNNEGVFGALNEAGRLYLNGEKGSYKYALKMLRGKDIPEADRESVLSMLFNINLVNPRYARYIISFLQQDIDAIGKDRLFDIINRELEQSLEEGFEQEVLNLLYFLRALEIHVEGPLLLKALKTENDFISIIALDFWVNRKDLVKRTRREAANLNETVTRFEKNLYGASMDGEHWLLLYEARMHALFKVDISKGKTATFFEKMQELGISFYQPNQGVK